MKFAGSSTTAVHKVHGCATQDVFLLHGHSMMAAVAFRAWVDPSIPVHAWPAAWQILPAVTVIKVALSK
jgi:hypothetical protein